MIRAKMVWGLLALMFLVLVFSPGRAAIAQWSGSDVQMSSPNLGIEYPRSSGLTNVDPRIIFAKIIRVALGLIGVVLLGLVLYGGFLWMTAGGNSDNIEKAKQIISASVIGLAIVLSAYALASFVMVKLLGATTSGAATSIF